MQRYLYRFFIELTNKRWSSRLLERYTGSSLSKPMIRPFMKAYRINEQEMAYPVEHYQTLHDFFMRQLVTDARTIDYGEDHVISPVDAMLAETGMITSGYEIMVKGKSYSVTEMLGSNEKAAAYEKGTFLVFYLSPSHYHRIHSPINGRVVQKWTLGKHSYPVNRHGLKYGRAPLAKNYREITELEFETGKMAVVKVGAMFVNSIERSHNRLTWRQGEEVAYFNFGSTVVLLFEPGTFALNERLSVPCEIKVGEKVGTLI